MAGIVGTIWAGVALRRLKAGADPDSPPRAVAIPVPWEDEAGEALAALAERSMQLQVSVQDGTVYVSQGERSVEIVPQALKSAAP